MGRKWIGLALIGVLGCSGGEIAESDPAEAEEGSYTGNLSRAFRGGYAEGTRGDMNAIGTALAQRLPDAGGYPMVTTMDALAAELEPAYLRMVPRTDAWGKEFRYRSTGSGFTLSSDGRDGTEGTDDDLILTDGGFR